MSDVRGGDNGDEVDFSWGLKEGLGGKDRDVQIYCSFTYDGVEYSLYDSVYLFMDGESLPCIGKIIQIFECPDKVRKVKVLWFFHPSEVSRFLGDVNVLEKELLLATGCGRGLTNINPLEAIAGKCNVVCISKDQRNRQPSTEEIKTAHFVFYRTFDVQYRTISDILGEIIATIQVQYLLNKNDFLRLYHAKVDSKNLVVSTENPLFSATDTLVADKAVENDVTMGSRTLNNGGANDVLDKSKFQPPNYRSDTGLIKDLKIELVSKKDTVGAGVGSLLVKYDKGSNDNGDASRPCNTGLVALSATQVVLGAGQKTRLRSPDFKQTEVEVTISAANTRPSQSSSLLNSKLGKFDLPSDEKAGNQGQKSCVDIGTSNAFGGPVPSSTASDKTKSESGKAMHIESGAVLKLKSARINGKRKKDNFVKPLDKKVTNHGLVSDVDCGNSSGFGSVPSTTGSGKGNTEFKRGIHIGPGAERKMKSVNDSGTLEERPSKKLKLNDIATFPRDDGGLITRNSATVSAADKVSLPACAAAKTNDKGKMRKQLVSTSSGIPWRLKSNCKIENKSADNLHNQSTKHSKDLEKQAIMSSASKTVSKPVGATAATSQLNKGTSQGLANKLSSIGTREKSSDKVCKGVATLSKDVQNSALASNSNKASLCTKVGSGAKFAKGLEGTKDDHSKLKSEASDARAYGRPIKVTQRPPDENKWVQASSVSWEERMKEAHRQGTLVLLLNLDPTCTLFEVENIVWHGFGYGCSAKMVPRTALSSPHSGQAFAIFKTKEAAKKIVRELAEKCLILPKRRPLVGISVLNFSGKQSSFPGHLVIDKHRHHMAQESRETISTSHSSQPNNLEHEMALDWLSLQEKSNLWWMKLHKEQREEIEKLKARLKSK